MSQIDREELYRRIKMWKGKPTTIIHKVVQKMVLCSDGIETDVLHNFISKECGGKNPVATIASMKSLAWNQYGPLLKQTGAFTKLDPSIKGELESIWSNHN